MFSISWWVSTHRIYLKHSFGGTSHLSVLAKYIVFPPNIFPLMQKPKSALPRYLHKRMPWNNLLFSSKHLPYLKTTKYNLQFSKMSPLPDRSLLVGFVLGGLWHSLSSQVQIKNRSCSILQNAWEVRFPFIEYICSKQVRWANLRLVMVS